jgi:hypothetical protein
MSKFASLTAGLLARKGEAEPVATPFADQLLTRVGVPDEAADVRALTPMPHHHVHTHVEPGAVKKPPAPKPLNDSVTSIFGAFGKRSAQDLARARLDETFEAPRTPLHPAAHEDEEPIDNHCGTCPGPSPEDATKTFHVNLRMKRQRFVKLKLSSALLRKPVQEIVAEALDDWFDRLPIDVMGDCACLKARGD